jgi:PAS domain S-box-containing protein
MRTVNRNSGPAGSSGSAESASSPADSNMDSRVRDAVATAQAIFSADSQGNFTACNQVFIQLFGYEPQDLAGRKFAGLFSREEKASKQDTLQLEKTIAAA